VAVALVPAAARQLDAVEVRGRSMAPSLLPGDRLLVVRLRRPPRAGEIVLAPDPRDPSRELIKRVVGVDGRAVALRGDNPGASTDGRTFGAVPASAVGWRVAFRYWPPNRIGRVPRAVPAFEPTGEGGEPACAVPEALIAGD
jgi:nickel-type superoxide dismutase maturation protease